MQLLGPLSGDAYGMSFSAGCPAIDAGDNTACPASDIRGNSRPTDGDDDGVAVCHMGAYERQKTTTSCSWLFLPLTLYSD